MICISMMIPDESYMRQTKPLIKAVERWCRRYHSARALRRHVITPALNPPLFFYLLLFPTSLTLFPLISYL